MITWTRQTRGSRRREAHAGLSASLALVLVLASLGALVVAHATAQTSPAGATVPVSAGPQAANCPNGWASSAPIVIKTDADWTPYTNPSGSGTPGTVNDPYVVGCLRISGVDSATSSAIYVAAAATNVVFIIHDVYVSLPNASNALHGINIGTDANGTSAPMTLNNNSISIVPSAFNGVWIANTSGSITLEKNLVSGFGQDGFQVNTGRLAASGNYVTGTGSTCEFLAIQQSGTVTGDSCVSNKGNGFVLTGNATSITLTDDTAEGNGGIGVSGGTTVSYNTIDGNGTGILPKSNAVITDNTINGNIGVGVDITDTSHSVIRGNTILDNGSAGIVAEGAQPAVPLSLSNLIDANHIGGSPFGVAFAYEATTNSVQNTDWTDGHQSFVRFADTATIVDAGSAVRAVVGSPASFADWIAAVRPGTPGPAGKDTVAIVTGGTFTFGDGSSKVLTLLDLPNAPGLLTHSYRATGTYTAELSVNAIDTKGARVSFSDTTPVTIVSPTPTTSLLPSPAGAPSWPMLGNTPDRSFYNGSEKTITRSSVNRLVPKWRFPTIYPVTASPAVATVKVPTVLGRTPVPTKVVFDGSFDGTFYAINAATGLPVWQTCLVTSPVFVTSEVSCDPSYPGNPKAQTDYGAIVASPEVVALPTGAQEVLAAANATMKALDPATGKVLWSFTGGSWVQAALGSTTCVLPGTTGATPGSPYDIESSPVTIGATVYFGMDSNGECNQGGGIYAISAVDGHMLWFFDPTAGRAFLPHNNSTMSWDPNLDLVDGQVVPGATCGGVWTSPAVDVSLGLLYASTANCPVAPIPPYEEGVFALDLATGTPVWDYQPRQIDSADMDYSATPNVFVLGTEHVVGVASKDGTYTLFDAATGNLFWSTKVALGGSDGGFYNAATDGTKIYLNSAVGEASGFAATATEDSLKGREYALDARTGNVVWRSYAGAPNLGQDAAVNGVYFTGGLDHFLHAFDTATGRLLTTLPLAGASSSGPAISDGELFVGAGTGATLRSAAGCCDPIFGAIVFPHPIPIYEYGQGIYGFCIALNPSCIDAINAIK